MAIYKEDIVDIELESGTIHRSWLMRAIGLGDAKGNRFGVRLLRNGEPVNVGSATVTGLFMAPNGTNYVINESQVSGSTWIDGNVAGVILPSGCYAVEGQFCLAIKLSQSGVVTTMRIIDGMVSNTGTTGAVVPSSNIPTGDQIIAAYQQAMAVIDNSVRYDVSQELTNAQKRQARLNVNAAGMALLAPVYSASSTYAVGDHVHYDGYYYVCNTAITTAEEWTAAHWTQVTVGGEVNDLKSAISASGNQAGYRYFIPISGSSIGISTKFKCEAKAGDKLIFTVSGSAFSGATLTDKRIYTYYAANPASAISLGNFDPGVSRTITVSEDMLYVALRYEGLRSGEIVLSIEPNVIAEIKDKIGAVENDIDTAETEIDRIDSSIGTKVDKIGNKQITPMNLQIVDGYENLLNPADFTDNKFLNADGTLSDNTTYQTSGFIPVVPGEKYTYVGRQTPTTESSTSSTQAFRTYVLYDIGKNRVSGTSATTDTPITIPNGVYFLRFCVSHTYLYMLLIAGSERKAYIPYGSNTYKVNDEYLPDLSQFVTMDNIKAEKEFVAPSMTTFMHYSKNMVDPATVSNGYINQETGALNPNDNHRATDFIPVVAGTTYGIIGVTNNNWSIRYCWYNSDKTRISGELTDLATLNYVLTAPTGAEYIRFSTNASSLYQPYYFAPSLTKPTYEPYGSGYVKPEYIPPEDLENTVVNLPSKVYAYVGYELNIYFENLVEDWTKYHWNVDCTKGRQMERGFNITPASGDVGSYELAITIWLSETVKKTVSTTLVILATSVGAGITKKIIILGDSTTANGIAVTKLNQNFENDSMHIQTLGTRGTAPNNHEGRSGWRFSSYFQPSTDPEVENPWYNPNTQTFDASYYFAQTGIAKPDWLFINLGINDTFGYGNDASLDSGIATIMQQCDAMITSIKNAGSGIKVGLCLTIPPNHSQDAFGKAYQCSQTRDRYKRNNVIWVNKLIEEYDEMESDRIYLIPIYTNLDTVYNMGLEALPVNARNTDVTYQSPIGNGGVHPVESGYWQIADVYTAFLKAHAED